MSLYDTVLAYYFPLHHTDPAIVEYYFDIFEGINCAIWQASKVKANMQAANWQACRPLIGWHGTALMLPGA